MALLSSRQLYSGRCELVQRSCKAHTYTLQNTQHIGITQHTALKRHNSHTGVVASYSPFLHQAQQSHPMM